MNRAVRNMRRKKRKTRKQAPRSTIRRASTMRRINRVARKNLLANQLKIQLRSLRNDRR
jgi:hypothetical protein